MDRIGNACTCGDPSFDGIVDDGTLTEADPSFDTEDDVDQCQELLALPPGEMPLDAEAAERCQVTAGEGDFSIVDILVMELETSGEDSGIGDVMAGSLQACSAADSL